MTFVNDQTLSAEYRAQINSVLDVWVSHLGSSLLGVYLHGSLALNSFVEGVSDIDILIVSDRRIRRDERLSIAEAIIELDRHPAPLEMSAMWIGDLNPWTHPTPCQFHYSDTWTDRYEEMLSGKLTGSFIIDEDFADADIACHVRLTNQCGICIYGKPINEVFPAVPEQDFWQSINADISDWDFSAYAPRYFSSNILVLGRVLSYKREKRILSKYEAGLWALGVVPESLRYIVDSALKSWYLKDPMPDCDPKDLDDLRQFFISEIEG